MRDVWVRTRAPGFALAASALLLGACGSGTSKPATTTTTQVAAPKPVVVAPKPAPKPRKKHPKRKQVAKPAPVAAVPVAHGSGPLKNDPSDVYITGPIPSRTYSNLKLTGTAATPGGVVPSATGTISVSGKTGSVCWTFSHLVGINDPTIAYLDNAPPGQPAGAAPGEVALGAHYSPSGCVGPEDEIVITAIARTGDFQSVTIDYGHGPKVDTVQSQLAPVPKLPSSP